MSAHGTYDETDGRPAVRFVRELRHAREAVWRMVTDPAELAYWFPCDVELELRTGAPMRFIFDPGSPSTARCWRAIRPPVSRSAGGRTSSTSRSTSTPAARG